MIEVWATQRPVRLLLAGGFLVAGFSLAALLVNQRSFTITSAVFVVGLAALLGAGKLATP